MKAIILAAGYATRLYPLTKDTPKALLPVAGRTILDRLLDGMRAIPEIDHIHLVTNHRFAPAFEEWRQTVQVHCPITVHDDGTTSNEDRLGAVGDIAFVLERAGIDDDLFVAASDNLFTFPLSDFAADFRRHGRDLLLGTRIDDVDTLRQMINQSIPQVLMASFTSSGRCSLASIQSFSMTSVSLLTSTSRILVSSLLLYFYRCS